VDFLVVGLGNPGIEFVGSRHNMGAEVAAVLADRYQGRLRPEKGLHSLACEIRIGARRVMVAVPQTFMNESGRAVAPLVRRAGIDQLDEPDAVPKGIPDPAVAPQPSSASAPSSAAAPPSGVAPSSGEDSAQKAGEKRPARSDPPGRAAGIGARLIVVHDELDLPSGRIKVKAGGGSAGNNGLKSIDSHLHDNGYLRVRVGIGKPPGRQPGADFVLKRPGAAERAVLEVAIEEAADAVELIVTAGPEAAMNRVNAAG
jgi:peptidyl-tRNA hydrolase